MNIKDLSKRFKAHEIEWRVGRSGMGGNGVWASVLAYVDARAVMNRLDEVCGPQNWQDTYRHEEHGVMCGIGIKVGDEWVWKWDGSPETDIEGFKGGISKALVRCSSKWGIGRYLYDLPATYANIVQKGTRGAKYGKDKKSSTSFFWVPPDYDELMISMDEAAGRHGMVSAIKAGKRRGDLLVGLHGLGVMEGSDVSEILDKYKAKDFHELPASVADKLITRFQAIASEEVEAHPDGETPER